LVTLSKLDLYVLLLQGTELLFTRYKKTPLSLALFTLLLFVPTSFMHSNEAEPNGWLADFPTLFRAGSAFACSMGASAAFVASAYILAQTYQAHIIASATHTKKSYLPPREFWWSTITGSAFIAALFLLTESAWGKQT
jgi:hypothetical protein